MARVLGPPEVLEVMEVPEPEINEDEVLIRVAAAGMNHQDVIERKRSLPPEVKQRLGLECSGTIQKVGKQVKRWKVGQQVNFPNRNLSINFQFDQRKYNAWCENIS